VECPVAVRLPRREEGLQVVARHLRQAADRLVADRPAAGCLRLAAGRRGVDRQAVDHRMVTVAVAVK
jgi:hypothetical protein